MDKKTIIKTIKQMPWDVWMYRDYDFLAPYLMVINATKEAYKTQGVNGEFPIVIYDSHYWYINKKLHQAALKSGSDYLKKVDIFILSKQCELLYKMAKKKINKLLNLKSNNHIILYKEVLRLIEPLNIYVWVAHQADFYYENLLRQKLRRRMDKSQIDKFIGDISFPVKKNAHNLLEDDIHRGVSLKALHKEYAWMKARNKCGFAKGYSLAEIQKIKKEVLNKKIGHKHKVNAPADLKKWLVKFRRRFICELLGPMLYVNFII